jgi:replicative DNA helicase
MRNSRQRQAAEQREACRLEWQPVGNGARTLIIAEGIDTGTIADIDSVDLARADDRTAYAVRACARFGRWTLEQLDAELLRIAVARCAAEPEPEAPAPTLGVALEEWRDHETVPTVCTGFTPFDQLAAGELPGGLPLGQLVILLGRPGTGKSALALQATIGALLGDPDLRAVWGLGEMSLEALARRSIAVGSVLLGMSPVPMRAAGRRTDGAQAVADELQRQIGDRLTIVPPTLTVDRIEMAVAASGARLVVCDYLQIMKAAGAVDSRHEAESVLAGLRAMSLTHGCAVILISSVAKAVDSTSRAGSLTRNTGQADFDADILLVGEADEQGDENGLVPVRWRCAKHRHGERRDLFTMFDGPLQLFNDAEAAAPDPAFADFAMPGARR